MHLIAMASQPNSDGLYLVGLQPELQNDSPDQK